MPDASFHETDLADVPPGAVLEADVLDARGNTLMRAGQRLELRLVEALRKRGVKSVRLRSAAVAAPAAAGGGNNEKVKTGTRVPTVADDTVRVAALFAPHAGDPLMDELLRVVLAALAARKEKSQP